MTLPYTCFILTMPKHVSSHRIHVSDCVRSSNLHRTHQGHCNKRAKVYIYDHRTKCIKSSDVHICTTQAQRLETIITFSSSITIRFLYHQATATSINQEYTSSTTLYAPHTLSRDNALQPPHFDSVSPLYTRHSSSNLQLLYLCFYSNPLNSTSTRNTSCAKPTPFSSCKCAETHSRNGSVERADD